MSSTKGDAHSKHAMALEQAQGKGLGVASCDPIARVLCKLKDDRKRLRHKLEITYFVVNEQKFVPELSKALCQACS